MIIPAAVNKVSLDGGSNSSSYVELRTLQLFLLVAILRN